MDNATLFLVDDDESVRRSLAMMLRTAGYTVEEFGSGKQLLADYEPIACGCILMDIIMPDISGLDVLDRMADKVRSNPIILMTGQADVPMATRALESGAFAFIEKPFRREDLISRIESAIEFDRQAQRKQDRRDELQRRFLPLTPREREVLDLVVDGKLTKQIAVQLGISQRTVETHRGNIMTKLRTDTLAELVAVTIENRNARLESESSGASPSSSLQRPWRSTEGE